MSYMYLCFVQFSSVYAPREVTKQNSRRTVRALLPDTKRHDCILALVNSTEIWISFVSFVINFRKKQLIIFLNLYAYLYISMIAVWHILHHPSFCTNMLHMLLALNVCWTFHASIILIQFDHRMWTMTTKQTTQDRNCLYFITLFIKFKNGKKNKYININKYKYVHVQKLKNGRAWNSRWSIYTL